MSKKIRLDQLLVQRGLAENRSKAQALILAGAVRVAGQARQKPGDQVLPDAALELRESLPYASRGGYKLAHALDAFALDPAGLAALDAGASTGGFTDVLLQRGATRVYAVDVGYGLLDWRLRQDPRVVPIERTNIRYLEALPEPESGERRTENGEPSAEESGVSAPQPPAPGPQPPATQADCAVIDVSFISLRLVLPAVQRLVRPEGWIVALVKPQFEAGQEQVGKGGVVRDPAVHAAVLRDVLGFAAANGLPPHGLTRSPITGPAGNIEFLAWLGGPGPNLDIEQAIRNVLG
ncbi:MAG TPA: TlyA family RNA methyltransferase [Roseiflexaceae bacterium]|nr:TlyA family RNA methyltransferase [Roseiflexaceae bacterium]